MSLDELLRCANCKGEIRVGDTVATCSACGATFNVRNGIVRFIESDTHENFSIQWNMFSDVQLDSRNGTTDSRDRLLNQSGLRPQDFAGKLVLEVGSGAGRFTEMLIAFGAKVVSSDFSGAVEANAKSNADAIRSGQLILSQADVFALPYSERAFDLVLCYGVVQHTGDPKRALHCLWKHVKPGGLLLVDQYQVSLVNFNLFKYSLRPVTKHLAPMTVLKFAKGMCRVLLPLQWAILRRTQGGGLKRLVRLIVNRSPNAVYSVNLNIAGKLDKETAARWSIQDTFDQYAPRYDKPCTRGQWKRQLEELEGGEIELIVNCGQGNAGVVRRHAEDSAPSARALEHA